LLGLDWKSFGPVNATYPGWNIALGDPKVILGIPANANDNVYNTSP
jgi:hypothetical protein